MSLSIKVVHLEPVKELTTSALIATLQRFIARRRMPSTLWSDNGTNFVGSAKQNSKLISDPELRDQCITQRYSGSLYRSTHPTLVGYGEPRLRVSSGT